MTKNLHKGFTLIETVIYLGLFSIVMGGFIISAFYLLDSGNRSSNLIAVQEEGTFLNRKLSWAIGSAIDADLLGPDTLSLTRGGETIIVTYDAGTEAIRMRRDAGPDLPLSSAAFSVTDVVFTVTYDPIRPTYVGVSFKIEGEPFRLDIYLRQ